MNTTQATPVLIGTESGRPVAGIRYKFDRSDAWILRRAVEYTLEAVTDDLYLATDDLGSDGILDRIRGIRSRWQAWLKVRRALPTDDETSYSGEIDITPEMLEDLKWGVLSQITSIGAEMESLTLENFRTFDQHESHDVLGSAFSLLSSLCTLRMEGE